MARRATLRLPVSAGELRARLYAADLVLAERIADDGAFEIDTELSEFELLKWAREPGVEVLTLAGRLNLYGRRCLPTIVARLAKQLTMAWNQPGNSNNNPWGKKPAPGGGDLDQAFKDWQKRIESLFGGGGGGRSSTPLLIIGIIVVAVWMATGFYQVQPGNQGVVQRFGRHVADRGRRLGLAPAVAHRNGHQGRRRRASSPRAYKSRVLTAEPNMVELQVAVQYRITGRRGLSVQGARSEAPRSAKSARAPFAKWWAATTSRPSSKRSRVQDRRGHARHHAAHARPVRRRHRSAQREHHRRAGARSRAAGAARFGQGARPTANA